MTWVLLMRLLLRACPLIHVCSLCAWRDFVWLFFFDVGHTIIAGNALVCW